MSADNYAMCPRCRGHRQAKAEAARDRVTEAYGVVDLDEFDRLRAEADRLDEQIDRPGLKNGDETFREDYSIGIRDDELVIRYRGGCPACGLSLSFDHSQPVEEEGA